MKKAIVAAIFASLFCGNAFAKCLCEKMGLNVAAKLGMFSRYVSRGVASDEDTVIQNELSITYKGFNFDYWMNMPATVDRDSLDSNEIDLNLSYGLDIGRYSLRAGHISYQFSYLNGLPTREWYVSAGINSLPVSLCFTYYNDYDQNKGSYSSMDLGKDFPVGADSVVVLTPSLHAGAYNGYANLKSGGDIVAGAKAAFKLLDNLNFTPSVNYSMPYGDVADENIGKQKAVLYGGANFEINF
jgi:hypothetical protein